MALGRLYLKHLCALSYGIQSMFDIAVGRVQSTAAIDRPGVAVAACADGWQAHAQHTHRLLHSQQGGQASGPQH